MSGSAVSRAVEEMQGRLREADYIADPALATCLQLMSSLQKPLLLEGDAGVGKTEVAKALARADDCELVRLQCYEGLDLSSAVYEWDYQRQLLAIRSMEARGAGADEQESIFSSRYLLERPLMQAIRAERPVVLLIDEIDRADEEFEAFLLELLSDWQISVPELGTVRAKTRPTVILTANGTRELSDALRRRCLYFYVDYPSFEKELRILRARLPALDNALAMQVVAFVQRLREAELRKAPGIAETLDWAAALMGLQVGDLRRAPQLIAETLVCLLKTQEDQAAIDAKAIAELIQRLR